MRVVEFIMGGIEKDPGGGVRKLSEDIAFYNNKLDPVVVRRWTLPFIQNSGIFSNHSYKKREPAGVITDPAAREDMKRWMMIPCSCASCTLSKQDGFRSQKSGLEEVYENHNKIHGTSHQCKFFSSTQN